MLLCVEGVVAGTLYLIVLQLSESEIPSRVVPTEFWNIKRKSPGFYWISTDTLVSASFYFNIINILQDSLREINFVSLKMFSLGAIHEKVSRH